MSDKKKLKRAKKALEIACDMLASRGIPFDEVTNGGFIKLVSYKSAEDWKKYFYELADEEKICNKIEV